MKRAHRQIIGATQMDGELVRKVIERIEAVRAVKAFLIFPMATLDFSVVPWGIWTD